MSFERELVKQRILPDAAFPHHVTNSDPPDRIESAQPSAGNPYFFNGIGQQYALGRPRLNGAIAPIPDTRSAPEIATRIRTMWLSAALKAARIVAI
jgi:hypothetical protein